MLSQWVRHILGLVGLIPSVLGVLGVYTALWVLASMPPPRATSRWTQLLSGALMVAVGARGLHLVTVLVLAPRVEQAATVYGAIAAPAPAAAEVSA